MPSSLNGIGITFNDGTTQSTAAQGSNYVMVAFTAPGTWTKPAGLKAVKVTVVGAGAIGGSAGPSYGSGGGAGGAAIRWISASDIPGPVAVTRGAQPGGTSSFGAFASATGGSAGASGTIGGAGGIGSGGTINIGGGDGGAAMAPAISAQVGGSSIFGAGGSGGLQGTAGRPGKNYGGGGGGGTPGGRGNGADGVVIVEEFYG